MTEQHSKASNRPLRVAPVTGANRGFGLATAAGLAEQGLRVLLAARDPSAAERAATELMAAGSWWLLSHSTSSGPGRSKPGHTLRTRN